MRNWHFITMTILASLFLWGFQKSLDRASQCETDFYKLQLQKQNYEARKSAIGGVK